MGVSGGDSNSQRGFSSMDGTAGLSSTDESSSMTAVQSQSKPATAIGVLSEATPHPAAVETLNGSTAAVNCHIPGGGEPLSDSSPSAVTHANGPASARQEGAAGTIFRTSLNAHNIVTSPVASPQPSVKIVPTVTLVRPPMQTSTNDIQNNPATVLTPSPSVTCATTGSAPVNKADSIKTIIQTGVVASTGGTGTTATVKSPTVLQTLRTTAQSTITATPPPPGGIRTIAPQVLGPRLSQPQRNATTIQNLQIPPGSKVVRFKMMWFTFIHAVNILPSNKKCTFCIDLFLQTW